MPTAFSSPKKVSKRGILGDGRPTKQTPEMIKKICSALAMGLNNEEAALVAGITDRTFAAWSRDPIFVGKTKRAVALRLYKRLERIESGVEGWQGTSWCLERLYGARFAKPEIQLSFNATTQNNFLSISITGTEAKEIEATAEPVRESVRKMFEGYKPQLSDGNGNKNGEPKPVVSIEAEIVQAPVIEHKEGDDSPAFWVQFTGGRERRVESGTAEYVVRVIGSETVGVPRTGEVSFKGEVTVGDVLDRIERLTPGSGIGWQALQRKAGIRSQN